MPRRLHRGANRADRRTPASRNAAWFANAEAALGEGSDYTRIAYDYMVAWPGRFFGNVGHHGPTEVSMAGIAPLCGHADDLDALVDTSIASTDTDGVTDLLDVRPRHLRMRLAHAQSRRRPRIARRDSSTKRSRSATASAPDSPGPRPRTSRRCALRTCRPRVLRAHRSAGATLPLPGACSALGPRPHTRRIARHHPPRRAVLPSARRGSRPQR